MPTHDQEERISTLFKDIERLTQNPAINGGNIRAELDNLQARLRELETQIQNHESNSNLLVDSQNTNRRGIPILYETERVGYVYSGDNIESIERAQPRLNQQDNIFSAPLTINGINVGGVMIQPDAEHTWTRDEIKLTEAVAEQVSLQVQSLRLLSSAERARAEAESATRQFMHEGWNDYLDAIERDERIGFQYNQSAVTPFSEKIENPEPNEIEQTITVMDHQIGKILLKPDPARPVTESDITLINAVTAQIGQQVENIRLLADAARARADAEFATRQLTRDSWMNFNADTDKQDISRGFIYDSNKVAPIGESPMPDNISLKHDLVVRGETIGHLSVAGLSHVPDYARQLADSIAKQTSIHLETLRLNEELQKRAKELQELDRLKSAFLANMSHELRTPLNSILGFADVMLEELDGPLTENMQNDLGLIYKNGQHLLHLINDVLDMAKIESGKMNLNVEKFNLQEVIEEVTSITSTLASEKNLALFIENDSDHEIEINADKIRLRQVLINLINNSIKFTEKGKISIHVAREETHVLIRVKDTGIGIPADLLEAIFQEFTQVDTSTTRKVGGTGLGLPISRRLINMHSGRLWAESAGIDGEGSTFYVQLPIEANINEEAPLTSK